MLPHIKYIYLYAIERLQMKLTKIESGKRVWLDDLSVSDDKAIHLVLTNELGFEYTFDEDEPECAEYYKWFDGGGIEVCLHHSKWTIGHRHTFVTVKSRDTLFDQIREVWEIEAKDREQAKGRVVK